MRFRRLWQVGSTRSGSSEHHLNKARRGPAQPFLDGHALALFGWHLAGVSPPSPGRLSSRVRAREEMIARAGTKSPGNRFFLHPLPRFAHAVGCWRATSREGGGALLQRRPRRIPAQRPRIRFAQHHRAFAPPPCTMPVLRSLSRMISAAASGEMRVVSSRTSARSGGSYGESTPVKFFSSPRRAFL